MPAYMMLSTSLTMHKSARHEHRYVRINDCWQIAVCLPYSS